MNFLYLKKMTQQIINNLDDNPFNPELISNIVGALAGLIPEVGFILKPIVSYILNLVFDHDGGYKKFIEIIDEKISEYSYETAIGELKSFKETGFLLEKSIENFNKNNKKSDELITRNEICMNNALRIVNIYMEVGRNNIDAFNETHSIIAMSAFMYLGLVLDTIKHGKEWGYDSIDGLQLQMENKADEVFRFLIDKAPTGPWEGNPPKPNIAAMHAQQSLIYFRKGYNNLDNEEVCLNIKNIDDEKVNPPLKLNRKNILVGSMFGNNNSYGYETVAYDMPAYINNYSDCKKLSANVKIDDPIDLRLNINIIHAAISEDPTGTFIEIFFDNKSVYKMELYPGYSEDNSNIIDIFHHGNPYGNYKDIRYITLKEVFIIKNDIKNVRFDIYNNNTYNLADAFIYHVEVFVDCIIDEIPI
jgi:hypothetical protein